MDTPVTNEQAAAVLQEQRAILDNWRSQVSEESRDATEMFAAQMYLILGAANAALLVQLGVDNLVQVFNLRNEIDGLFPPTEDS